MYNHSVAFEIQARGRCANVYHVIDSMIVHDTGTSALSFRTQLTFLFIVPYPLCGTAGMILS